MNKKMMAIFMSALMVVAAMCIVVASPTDADDVGTENNPKYIIGAKEKGVVVYVNDTLTGSIDFNKGAYSANVVVKFIDVTDKNNNKEIGPNYGDNKIKIVEVENNPGSYIVYVDTASQFEGKKIIKLVVEEKIPGSDGYFDKQFFYYAVNVDVRNIGKIKLEENNSNLSKVEATQDNPEHYTYDFKFSTNVNILTSVVDVANNEEQYKFYATGLPSGISMKVTGNIGGKISKNSVVNNGDALVYAVSEHGKVIMTTLKWNIKQTPMGADDGTFVMKYSTADNAVGIDVGDGGHIAINSGKKINLIVTPKNGFNAENIKVTGYAGTLVEKNGGIYKIDNDGAGTFKVTVTADIEKIPVAENEIPIKKKVVKSFTVYVVGSIVDADLDPAVESR